MNKIIWKYPLKKSFENQILVSKNAEILCVREQDDVITLWMVVDPTEETEIREFIVLMTGHEYSFHHLIYVGTVELSKTKEILHVFENMS